MKKILAVALSLSFCMGMMAEDVESIKKQINSIKKTMNIFMRILQLLQPRKLRILQKKHCMTRLMNGLPIKRFLARKSLLRIPVKTIGNR